MRGCLAILQGDAAPFAPRIIRHLLGKALFVRRRDLLIKRVVVLMMPLHSAAPVQARALGKRGHGEEHSADPVDEAVRDNGIFVPRSNAALRPCRGALPRGIAPCNASRYGHL